MQISKCNSINYRRNDVNASPINRQVSFGNVIKLDGIKAETEAQGLLHEAINKIAPQKSITPRGINMLLHKTATLLECLASKLHGETELSQELLTFAAKIREKANNRSTL